MDMASDPSTRNKVTAIFQQTSKYKMNVARALQSSPSVYNKQIF